MKPDNLILALDTADAAEALRWVNRCRDRVGCFKVGLQLYTAHGPDIVRAIRRAGARVFLDLKLHDIPNTVAAATEAACRLDVEFLTIHTLGGAAMLAAAVDAAAGRATLLGITVLTAHGDADLAALGLPRDAAEQTLLLARLARDAGLRGLVCSPREVAVLRRELGSDFCLVTPGIRPAGSAVNDQNRIATPAAALAAGSSRLVIGRPITAAPDPDRVLHDILTEEL